RDYLEYIIPVPGDLLKMKWTGEPIEILFVDIAKSWALNNWVLSETFPRLIPGTSVVIQQDYCHFVEWWLQVVMEYFSDRFEFLEVIKGASAIFRCIAPISNEEAQRDLSRLPLSEKIRLMERAAARVPAPAAEMLKCGRAQCFVQHGEPRQAEELLQTITTSKMTDQVELDFSEIVKDNVGKVRTHLKRQ